MPNFAGTWKMRSSENFDELLKALGELGAGWGDEAMEGTRGGRSGAVPGAARRLGAAARGRLRALPGNRGADSPARAGGSARGSAAPLCLEPRLLRAGLQRCLSAPRPEPDRCWASWRTHTLLPPRFAQVSTPCLGRWRWRPPPNPTWRFARTGTSSTSKLPPLSAPRRSTSKSGRASRRRRWMAENAG